MTQAVLKQSPIMSEFVRTGAAMAAGYAASLVLTSCAPVPPVTQASAPASAFVQVENAQFMRDGEAYRFVGVNMWYGAYLGSSYGDRARLVAELDHLASLGITNLRVLAASEESPLRDAISPAFQNRAGAYDEELLRGLDLLLAEMAKRDMQAVLYLGNFWEWSGGMTTYMHWDEGRDLIDPANPDIDFWPAYMRLSAEFYSSRAAQERYQAYIEMLIGRTNTVTGITYNDDPTIMAWQLANEPRLGTDDAIGEAVLPAFLAWVEGTARFIDERAPKQLVSIGNEGTMGCLRSEVCFRASGDIDGVDYLTVHMWPKNWSWIDPSDMAGTVGSALERGGEYLEIHAGIASKLGKPIVLEEFGMPRDGEAYAAGTSVAHRDRFLAAMLGRIEADAAQCGVIAGSNYWAWGGAGRAERPSAIWQAGDRAFVGDPPQEPQGLNSIYDDDASTLSLLREHSARLEAKNRRCN